MILPDANLLLYAYDTASPFHEPAKDWWRECLDGTEPVGVCTVVSFAFLRLSTSRRVFSEPLSIAEATGHVRSWLARSVCESVVVEPPDVLRAMEWLEALGSGANLTTDAQIAAVAHRCRGVVHTADTDFQRFPRVKWRNPLRGKSRFV